MKAISIRQPWASSIILVGKDVENRSWPTKYRGPILIAASKGMTVGEVYEWQSFVNQRIPVAQLSPMTRPGTVNLRDLPRGGIIGQAWLVDCVTHSKSQWFTGPYGFVLEDVEPLPFRPCRGMLGLFEVP